MKKYIWSILLLLGIAAATVIVISSQSDMAAVITAIRNLDPVWLALSVISSLTVIALEGCIIYFLLRSLGKKLSFPRSISWSFIGFFFSGITPSSTGGQPMQMYFMNRSGIKVSESAPVLLIVALLYKIVVTTIGGGMLLFWYDGLAAHFGKYFWIFFLGMGLHAAFVGVLLLAFFRTNWIKKIAFGVNRLYTRLRRDDGAAREQRITTAVAEYLDALQYFKEHTGAILIATAMTCLQRCIAFILPWLLYRGFGLQGESVFTLAALQSAVYIVVDIMPLPGSAGIAELVNTFAFASIFSQDLLTAFLYVSRGISFYLPLILSAIVTMLCYLQVRREGRKVPRRDGKNSKGSAPSPGKRHSALTKPQG